MLVSTPVASLEVVDDSLHLGIIGCAKKIVSCVFSKMETHRYFGQNWLTGRSCPKCHRRAKSRWGVIADLTRSKKLQLQLVAGRVFFRLVKLWPGSRAS